MEYIHTIRKLRKHDTRIIPEQVRTLADCLHWLSEDPDWSVVQSDKTGQWIPILVNDYIADMEIHLHRYCNKIPRSHLDRVYKDTMSLIDEIDHLCSDGEEQFLRSWAKTKKIPSVRLSITKTTKLSDQTVASPLG
jgi:hypothetical protein